MAQRAQIYQPMGAKAPAEDPLKSLSPGASVVSDLDGCPPQDICYWDFAKDHAQVVASLNAFLDKARATEALFAKGYDGDSAMKAAMEASEALWRVEIDGGSIVCNSDIWAEGVTQIPHDWRTRGVDTAMQDPCDRDGKPISLKVAPVGPAFTTPSSSGSTSSTPTNASSALAASLALDPAKSTPVEVAVVAKATGGAPPYRYQWTGARSDSGERAIYAAPKSAAEQATASVKVTDAAGAVATATLPLAAPKIAVNLIKTSPASNQIRVGETVSFAVELKADGKTIDPAGYTLRWEPNTQAHFAQAEGLGVKTNSATFSRLGKVKVWVVALAKAGGALATVGESQQIELDVSASILR